MHAIIDSASPWLNEHIKSFIRHHVPDAVFVDDVADFPVGVDNVFQWCDGWALNQNFAALSSARNGSSTRTPTATPWRGRTSSLPSSSTGWRSGQRVFSGSTSRSEPG
jgi:hypothetical protein